MDNQHIPVMLKESIEGLDIKKDHWYIDCNFGGGGHSKKILEQGGRVIAIDLDQYAFLQAIKKFNLQESKTESFEIAKSDNLILVLSNFNKLTQILNELSIDQVAGVLFDLGLSSNQLTNTDRGFSFLSDAPLDMRMDQSFGATAKDLVNGLHQKELTELFLKYGEETYAFKIAQVIIRTRQEKQIATTKELADLVSTVKSKGDSKIHPATKVFQALRIAVNDELNTLKETLPQALDCLKSGGRIVVISFHSLEDRIVKNFFNEMDEAGKIKIVTKKPLIPSEEEININSRSRSAKLRIGEKI